MRLMLKIMVAALILLIILFVVSLVPKSVDTGYIIEKSSLDSAESYIDSHVDKKYLDELKKRFIGSGISEGYFDENIKLIYSYKIGDQIHAWYTLKTHSWLDTYNINSGGTFPICKDRIEDEICKKFISRIHGWVNLNFANDKSITAYSIQGKIWHNDKVVENTNNVPFTEIKNILSPWKAGLISKSCVPISLNKYRVILSPRMTFEYVVNGENFSTMFDSQKHMQARVDLATGELSCSEQASIIY